VEDLAGDAVALAEDTPLVHRAAGTSAEAMHFRNLRVGLMAEAGRFTAVEDIPAVARIMAAEDTIAQPLDSVSAFTRLTDTPPRSVIPPDSMMHTACGNTIRAALFRTDIKY
jgi:hypothetical protein